MIKHFQLTLILEKIFLTQLVSFFLCQIAFYPNKAFITKLKPYGNVYMLSILGNYFPKRIAYTKKYKHLRKQYNITKEKKFQCLINIFHHEILVSFSYLFSFKYRLNCKALHKMSVKRIVLVHYYVLSKHLLSKLLYFPLIKYLFYSFRKYGTKMIPISYTQYLNAIQMNRMHNNTNHSEDCIVSLVKSIKS